jgi:hypothetical protein
MFDAPSADHCTKFSSGTGGCGSCCRLFVLLAAALLVFPIPSAAQTTQTLSLDEGWNLVSLRVQPDDSSFASIFDGAVSIVKNEDGDVYLPSEEIEQISTWRTGEGYKIHAETTTTLDVSGLEVPLGTTTIMLYKGWNVIPYLPTEARAVEKVLMSIDESLVVAEDESGTQYDPSASSSPLDSLRPGEGYKVYVDRADTLRYPEIAQTLDDALALTGMEVGSYVQVRGRDEPGDGGGGVFKVTTSGAEIDGGTAYAFDANVSAQQSVNINTDRLRNELLPDSNIVSGSVEVQLGQSSGQPVADKRHMHAHSANNAEGTLPYLDYKTGVFNPVGFVWFNALDWAGGTGFTVRYKHATSDRRLERVGVTNAVSIDWWGAKEANLQNPANNRWRIAKALNRASEIYQSTGYNWVYVDIPGEYYYDYTLRIPEGVKLRGASNRYESKTTQTFGDAANGEPTYGKLKVLPNSQMNYTKDGWIDNNIEYPLRMHKILLTHAKGASKFGMESLEVAGNIDDNLEPITNPNGDFGVWKGVQQQLQSTNAWNGFMSRPSPGWAVPEGTEAHFNEVYVHDFPGNGLASGNDGSGGPSSSPDEPHIDWSNSTNVRLGGAQRNHQIYRTGGTHDGWEFEDGGWASLLKVNRATLKNITITPGPNRLDQYWDNADWAQVFNHHGKDFDLDYFSNRVSNMTITGENIDIDLSKGNADLGRIKIHYARGYGGTWTNIDIQSDPNKITLYVRPVETGFGPIRDYTYENITITDQGGAVKLLKGRAHTHLTLRDFTIETAGGVTGKAFSTLYHASMFASSEYAETDQGNSIPLGMAARVDIENFTDGRPRGRDIIRAYVADGQDSHPYDLFLSKSSLSNSSSSKGLLRDATGNDLPLINDLLRVYLDSTEFKVFDALAPDETQDQYTHRFLLNTERTIRLRDCTTPSGLVSDESGSYTSDADDEGNDFVLIPTSLLSRAQERTATVTSGSRTVQSVEVANADGTLRGWDPDTPTDQREPYLKVNLDGAIQAGNTIAVDWTAKVTPTEDYQTTGLFIARPVANKTYASGNGPFTVDLRGVAASQETQDPIQYSASSGDTSVMTASVNSYTDPNENQIPWELELTEQGTGTATITVDAEIPGVGTATTTFEVTVE